MSENEKVQAAGEELTPEELKAQSAAPSAMAVDPEVLIKIQGVRKVYADASGKEVIALNGVDLEIHKNEFICVVGPSGCGKTTLLNIIAGLEKPTSGAVYINDRLIEGPGPDRGVIFQQYALFPWRTVKSNIMYGLKVHQERDSASRQRWQASHRRRQGTPLQVEAQSSSSKRWPSGTRKMNGPRP
jgi:ABC-type taurine transport system ATPase subunit